MYHHPLLINFINFPFDCLYGIVTNLSISRLKSRIPKYVFAIRRYILVLQIPRYHSCQKEHQLRLWIWYIELFSSLQNFTRTYLSSQKIISRYLYWTLISVSMSYLHSSIWSRMYISLLIFKFNKNFTLPSYTIEYFPNKTSPKSPSNSHFRGCLSVKMVNDCFHGSHGFD